MKSKLLLTMLLFAFVGSGVYAQGTFQKTYGGAGIDDAYNVKQTFDGGFIMTGTTSSIGSGSGDVFLVKTNSAGDTAWTRSYGGVMDDNGYAVQQTSDSGYIVSATTNSFGAGLHDVYLIKTNSSGDTLWTKTIGGPDHDYGYGVKQTFDGGYIVAGIQNNFSSFDNDMYLIKTDANGDVTWTRTYGGSNHDEAYAVQQTADSGYIVAGNRYFGPGSADVYVIKTNATGDTLWTKEYGGPDVDYGYDIEQTPDGGYIIAGQTFMGSGIWDAFLIKTNSTGAMSWTKTYGGASVDDAHSVHRTFDGGYVLGGSTGFGAGSYDMYLIKTDSLGDTLWTRTYGGSGEDRGYYVVQTSDSGYAIAGYTVTFATGSLAVYLVKTDAGGNTDCNQYPTTTIVTTPPTLVNSTPTVVNNPPVVETHPATVIHSGATVSVPCSGIGTNDMNRTDNLINVYPNPANQQINIQLKQKNEIVILSLIDVFGNTILQQSCKEKTTLNTANLSDGLYLLRIHEPGKIISTIKVAVQH